MFQCSLEKHIHFHCYRPSICKLMDGHFKINHEFEWICTLPQKIYYGVHMIFPILSFSHCCLEMLWIFCSLGNSSFILKAVLSLQLCFLTSPRAIPATSMKCAGLLFLALWSVGLKELMSPLINSFTLQNKVPVSKLHPGNHLTSMQTHEPQPRILGTRQNCATD